MGLPDARERPLMGGRWAAYAGTRRRLMREFHIGDFVELVCHDGKTFTGWILDFTGLYVVLTGPRGFPLDDIRVMVPGPLSKERTVPEPNVNDLDLTEFYKLSRPKRKPCAVGHALSQLKGETRKQLVAALRVDQGIITNAAVEQWLKGRKQEVTVSAVVSHRKGTCTCEETP